MPNSTAWEYFARWNKDGTLGRIIDALRTINASPETATARRSIANRRAVLRMRIYFVNRRVRHAAAMEAKLPKVRGESPDRLGRPPTSGPAPVMGSQAA